MKSYIDPIQPTNGTLIFNNNSNTIKASSYSFNKEIVNCELPDSCEYIERAAFTYCTELQSVIIPESVIEIESEVFSYCRKLKKISLPVKLTEISSGLFNGCDLLESIEIPANVKIIDTSAFYNCCSLKSVILNSSLTTIRAKAFSNCYSLKEIFIPDTVERIEGQAFYGCSSLKKIHIPNNIKYIGKDAFKGCKNLEVIENAEKVVAIDKSLIYSLPKIKEKIILPEGFSEGIFFEINNNEIENVTDLENFLNEELQKYNNIFSIYNLFYDTVVKGNTITTIANRYNIPESYIKEKLQYLAKKIRIKYLDDYYVPLNHRLLYVQERIKELFGLKKLELSYMSYKLAYLSDHEIPQVPDELKQKVEAIFQKEKEDRIKAEEERIKEQNEIKDSEISKLPYLFFSELNSLLRLNKTDSITIPGVSYNYIISRSEDSFVSIEKRNTESFYKLDYDMTAKDIDYFNYKDDSNTHNIDDYNEGLFFIYEFYNLFIQRKLSTILTNLYNLLTKNETDHFYFSTNDKNIFFKVEKPGNHLLVLLKINRDGNIIKKLAARKVEQIPFWFTISKSTKYTCITQVKRLITFFSEKKDKDSLFYDFITIKDDEKFTWYNPYTDDSEKTSAEKIIADFEENYVAKYLEIPEPEPEVYCPLCGKLMNLKTGPYGSFFGCSDYPRCRGSVNIKSVKK